MREFRKVISEESDLFYRVHRAKNNAVSAALNRAGLQDVGQPKILFLLDQEEDGILPTQCELAQRLHVSTATIANSLNSLERLGYVTRRSDSADGRKKRIAMTEKGISAREQCMGVFSEVDRQIYAGFDREELDRLSAYYLRMLDNLNQIGGSVECRLKKGSDGECSND